LETTFKYFSDDTVQNYYVQHVYCSRVYTQFLFKHTNSSHTQKQEWEYV